MSLDNLPISNRIDHIVAVSLHPHLKRLGFKKRGRTFRRPGQDCWQLVAVSGAAHNTNLDAGSVGSFSVTLGIHFPSVFAISGVDLGREPGIHECYVYETLKLPRQVGVFDDLTGGCPTTEVQADAVSNAWCEQGESWFSKYSNYNDAYAWVRNRSDWCQAMYFAIFLNDSLGAHEALAHCQRCWGGESRTYIEAVAAKHGVTNNSAG